VSALAGLFAFLFVAPATVAGWVPYAWTGWRMGPPLAGLRAGRIVGAVLVAVSTAALIECFVRFALVGRGTPAPVVPTESLVVSGLYRFTRNPMYLAVVSAIVGQAVIFGSRELLAYAAGVCLTFHVFVVGYEERTLQRRFGNYAAYCRHAPRWVPRLSPWTSSEKVP
jgi:protein-S-isoprenylcysteine O-methyltransferase Ste14